MPARPDFPPRRALAWLYSPAPLRAPLAALWALEQEIGTSLRPGLDHHVAHTRLEWWRAECSRCAEGEAQHPLTRALAEAFTPAGVGALRALPALVDNAAWDLAAATFESRRELSAYCERWSTAMIEPLGRLVSPAPAPAALAAIGRNLRELELLLTLAAEARAGRLRMPLDELAAAAAAPEELAAPPWSAALATLVCARHRTLRAELAAAVNALAPAAQAALRGLVVWVAIAAAGSRRAEALLPAACAGPEPRAPLDGWYAWRAARRAAAGRGLPVARHGGGGLRASV
jgi:phytoene synthase